MSVLRRDNNRGGGRVSRESSEMNRRSLGDLVGFDKSLVPQQVTAPTFSQRSNDHEGSPRWYEASSPETAQSPRASVPSGCFPPRHSTSFGSYSESARPGDGSHQDAHSSLSVPGLITTFGSMKLSSRRPRSTYASVPQSLNGERSALPEQAGASFEDRSLARRASFCGGTSSGSLDKYDVVWTGHLPPRCLDPSAGFSAKVFLGGLPWDISEQSLMHTLNTFHPTRVEWPGRDIGGGSPRGYAYVTFESEQSVRTLLASSRCDGRDWYYRITSRKMRNKEVQVIPWALSDCNWMCGESARLEPTRTVFVGALHGMISAAGLAQIMNDLFPGVIYAGIDTDKNKYPIGSGRVTFNNTRSYVRAISAAFVEIRTAKFTKRVQVDPYLEDSMCSLCQLQQGPYFCREPTCFGYFCRLCWSRVHVVENHKPMMRNPKVSQYSTQSNGLVAPAVRHSGNIVSLPSTQPLQTSGFGRAPVFNGGYHNVEGANSSPATSTSGISGPHEPEPRIASEAEPGCSWPL